MTPVESAHRRDRHAVTPPLVLICVAAAALVACSNKTTAATDGGASDGPMSSRDAALPGTDGSSGGPASCAAPVASAPAVVLASFDDGTIPNSEAGATEGFRAEDVTRGTIVSPGANGTTHAASFAFQTTNTLFFQGNQRPQYLDGSGTYHPDLANAVELYLRVPAGSAALSSTAATLGLWSYNWLFGDPWVGTNAGGGNLTDSQMHGYANFRLDPSAADTWQHVILTTSAFAQSRGNYHFYAARAVVADQAFFGTVRQFELTTLVPITAAAGSLALDEFRLVTLPPTAGVCPTSFAKTVPAGGGDVLEPITITNPTSSARSYRVFISSEIGVDRQTLEIAMHDTDSVAAVDDLQGGVGADGGLGAVELFADDGTGKPTGASVIASGKELAIPAGGMFRGVLVHHVTAAMLGAAQQVSTGGRSYTVTRNTLTTSVIVWDPAAPRVGDAAVVGAGSNADSSHAAPPGFPAFAAPPSGWGSQDVPIDQVGGYFVSILTLTP